MSIILLRDALSTAPEGKTAVSRPHSFEKPALIVFGPNSWNENWQTRQHYTSRLAARGWKVFYLGGGNDNSVDRNSPNYRFRWVGDVELTSNLSVWRPGYWDIWSKRFWAIDRIYFERQIRILTRWRAANQNRGVVVLSFSSQFAPFIQRFDDLPLVYFLEDAWNLMPGWSESDALNHQFLTDRAACRITCSAAMARGISGEFAENCRLLPNGVDSVHFAAGPLSPCPPDLERIGHPRIGYTGALNIKVDFNLIAEMAIQRPTWNFVLVGPVGVGGAGKFNGDAYSERGYAKCLSLSNIHFLGQKPYVDLPAYVGHMDVNIMCYRTDGNGWWKCVDPLKTNEYLATGLPVVSANQISVRAHGDNVAIATSSNEFLAAITRALHGAGRGSAASRQAIAQTNDWSLRVDQLEKWLLEIVR